MIASRNRSSMATQVAVAILLSLGSSALLAGPGGHHRGGAGPAFEQMDADDDGQVSRAEAEAFRQSRHAGLDANGDGIVGFEEARAFRQAKAEERARKRFARMDADGDGQVSMAEFNARSERWFERADRNHDGVISAEEREAIRGHRGGRHDGQGRS